MWLSHFPPSLETLSPSFRLHVCCSILRRVALAALKCRIHPIIYATTTTTTKIKYTHTHIHSNKQMYYYINTHWIRDINFFGYGCQKPLKNCILIRYCDKMSLKYSTNKPKNLPSFLAKRQNKVYQKHKKKVSLTSPTYVPVVFAGIPTLSSRIKWKILFGAKFTIVQTLYFNTIFQRDRIFGRKRSFNTYEIYTSMYVSLGWLEWCVGIGVNGDEMKPRGGGGVLVWTTGMAVVLCTYLS